MKNKSNTLFQSVKPWQIILLTIGIILVLGVFIFRKTNHNSIQNNERDKVHINHTSYQYKGISEVKTKQIQKATTAVDKALTERIQNEKNDDDVKLANKLSSNIKSDDNDTHEIRKAYENVMMVVNGSSIDRLQVARSYLANLSNTTLSKELENKFTEKMVTATARDISDTPSYVESQTKPLTKEKLKLKEAEMVKKDAKAKADYDAQVRNTQAASSEDAENEKTWSSNATVTP
ncbi:hypothetical protein FGL74_07735 [Leuconostoc koreense]|nr:hypothetical protein FGL74_07735 [Leuconostoc mesenteroides]QGM25491.1 hypothetical protein GJV51_05695 [Leuconostoc mesenteroides subsp. mesenteroides]